MANSADKDRYEDFGLSPLTQKAFSKSALTSQTKLAPSSEEATGNLSKAWMIRLLFGLGILAVGIFAAKYVADMRKEEASQPATSGTAQSSFQPDSLRPASDSGVFQAGANRAAQADTIAKISASQAVEPVSQEWSSTTAGSGDPLPAKELQTSTSETANSQARKYYTIAGSYSSLALAKANKQRLPYRTRILVKDGKFRLISDSLISSKPPQYLIDSLKQVRPNLWLAKAQ